MAAEQTFVIVGASLAGATAVLPSHIGRDVVDQLDRDLVRIDHSSSDPPRHIQLGQTARRHDQELHRNWNANCKPFTWTADVGIILAKVRWIESEVHKLTEH